MSGPQMNDEKAMLIKITELVATTRDSGTEKDFAISGMAANNAVLDMKADKTIQLDTKTTKLLRHNGSVLVGESRSSDSAFCGGGSEAKEREGSGCAIVFFGTTREGNKIGALQKLGVG